MGKLASYTIVMVDDNIDEIFLTRRVMRNSGFVNRFISEQKPENFLSTLDELVQLGAGQSSFLVLLDINMPKIDGFELLKIIREHDEYRELPVLMLSASEDEEDMRKSEELGSDGYIVKPLNRSNFIEAIGDVPKVRLNFVQ